MKTQSALHSIKVKPSRPVRFHTHSRQHTPYQHARNPRGHRGLHLRMGCDQEGHGGHAGHSPRSLAPRSQALLTVSHSSTASPAGREAKQSRQLLVTLLDALPSMPSCPPPSRARKGGSKPPTCRKLMEKTHPCPGGSSLDKGSLGSSSVSSGLASGVQAPVPPFSSSWHPILPFPRLPSKL